MTSWLRYEFPDELQATAAALRWRTLSRVALSPAKLDSLVSGRPSFVYGTALKGAIRVTPWLLMVCAPGRTFLEVNLERLGRVSVLGAP